MQIWLKLNKNIRHFKWLLAATTPFINTKESARLHFHEYSPFF
jgi:hypothetical protein